MNLFDYISREEIKILEDLASIVLTYIPYIDSIEDVTFELLQPDLIFGDTPHTIASHTVLYIKYTFSCKDALDDVLDVLRNKYSERVKYKDGTSEFLRINFDSTRVSSSTNYKLSLKEGHRQMFIKHKDGIDNKPPLLMGMKLEEYKPLQKSEIAAQLINTIAQSDISLNALTCCNTVLPNFSLDGELVYIDVKDEKRMHKHKGEILSVDIIRDNVHISQKEDTTCDILNIYKRFYTIHYNYLDCAEIVSKLQENKPITKEEMKCITGHLYYNPINLAWLVKQEGVEYFGPDKEAASKYKVLATKNKYPYIYLCTRGIKIGQLEIHIVERRDGCLGFLYIQNNYVELIGMQDWYIDYHSNLGLFSTISYSYAYISDDFISSMLYSCFNSTFPSKPVMGLLQIIEVVEEYRYSDLYNFSRDSLVNLTLNSGPCTYKGNRCLRLNYGNYTFILTLLPGSDFKGAIIDNSMKQFIIVIDETQYISMNLDNKNLEITCIE